MGNGVKSGDTSFNPTSPPEVMDDPSQQVENPEPTPLHEPVEVAEPETNPEGEGAEDEG